MTREYILLNLEGACPIWFMDEPALRDEVMSTLQDSLLIPKPKFKVGDYVREIDNPDMNALCICSVFFDPAKMAWYYILSDNLAYDEHELKLVEEQK